MLQRIIDVAAQAEPYSAYGQLMVGALALALVLYSCLREPRLYPGIPAFGIDDKGWMKFERARKRYSEHGKQIVDEAIQQFSRPYQIATDVGVKIFLPARYAEEIKNNKHMSFKKAVTEEFANQYPGLEPLKMISSDHNTIQMVTRQKITQTLNLMTDDISEEADLALQDILGNKEEWTSQALKPLVLEIVARLSSRLFVGTELCRNEAWLRLARNYTLDSFGAARALRRWPLPLRRFLVWVLPEWRTVRQDVRDARRVLAPVIRDRLERNRLADEKGLPRPKTKDTIQWIYDALPAHSAMSDIADAQLALSVVAIHTTTELLTGILLDLAQNDEFIKELRDEFISVLTKDNESATSPSEVHDGGVEAKNGKTIWGKNTLYQMKLMDSALKESQRLHVRDIATMRRVAESEVKLSDGTVIPKGAFTWVTLDAYRDPARYPEPGTFRPRRFLEMRGRPGEANRWQLVSTSADHLGFGHGEHACPGRFFASNEVKIALVHLLMKYDWRLPGAQRPGDVIKGGTESGVDGNAEIMFRRRKEELQL